VGLEAKEKHRDGSDQQRMRNGGGSLEKVSEETTGAVLDGLGAGETALDTAEKKADE